MQLPLILAACLLMSVWTSDAKTLFKKHYKRTAPITLTCDEGKTKCPNGNECIRSSFFCDGDNDCGDNSDEENCENMTCTEGFTKCPNSNSCRPSSFFCDGYNNCGDNSDEENCGPITCSEGLIKCLNNNRCKPSSYFCDGDNDCGDNSDEENCAPVTCPRGRVNCPTGLKCIHSSYFCDGDNDCGDNSDEENCAPITCYEGYTKCPTINTCKPTSFFCDGDNDCGDNSDEENCAGGGRGPTTPSSNQSPSGINCYMEFAQTSNVCAQQVTSDLFGSMPFDPMQAFETLKKMDLEDICRPLLQWDDCIAPLDNLCESVEDDQFKYMQQHITTMRTLVLYVCVEEINALQRNKQCLLRESTNSGLPDIAMGTMMSCGRLMQSLESQTSPCPPEELMQCVKGAVVEQCGDDAGSLLERLVNRYSQLSGCQKRTMKSLSVMKKKKRLGIRSFEDLMKSFL